MDIQGAHVPTGRPLFRPVTSTEAEREASEVDVFQMIIFCGEFFHEDSV